MLKYRLHVIIDWLIIIRVIDHSIRVFRSGQCPGYFEEKLLTFLNQGYSKPHLSVLGLSICVLGAVATLLPSEKPQCNVLCLFSVSSSLAIT